MASVTTGAGTGQRPLSLWESALLGVRFNEIGRLLPGAVASIGIAVLANWLGEVLGKYVLAWQGIDPTKAASPVSGIMVAILIGLAWRNLFGHVAALQPGIDFSIKRLLRLGIILLGVRLSIYDALKLGAWGVPVVVLTIGTGLIVVTWFNRRLQQPERLGTLIAVSTGICGITAIVSTAPGIGANDEEVAYSVANVTLIGLVAMLVYPYLAHTIFAGDPVKAGLFLGTSVHETSQVAGAALIYGQVFNAPRAVDVATITKLLRNVFLALVVPVMSYYYVTRAARAEAAAAAATGAGSTHPQPRQLSFWKLLPTFILGFLAMAVVRSVGDAGVTGAAAGKAFGVLDKAAWTALWKSINNFGSNYMLGAAMAAVGLSTSFGVFKGVGMKPLYVGVVAAVVVGIVSIGAAFVFGPLMHM